MAIVKVVIANANLLHQIVLGSKKDGSLTMSCNCQPKVSGWPVPMEEYSGPVDGQELMHAWVISAKHRNPFTAEHVAQARRGVHFRLT